MEVQFYQAKLNLNLVSKAMIQDDPRTLLGWIQLSCDMEYQEQVVNLI